MGRGKRELALFVGDLHLIERDNCCLSTAVLKYHKAINDRMRFMHYLDICSALKENFNPFIESYLEEEKDTCKKLRFSPQTFLRVIMWIGNFNYRYMF